MDHSISVAYSASRLVTFRKERRCQALAILVTSLHC